MGQTEFHGESSREILAAQLERGEGKPLLVNPTKTAVRDLVGMYRNGNSLPTMRILADGDPLKDLTDDFIVASAIADLIEGGEFEIRTLSAVPRHSILVDGEAVLSLVEGTQRVAGLRTTDDAFVSALTEEYENRWEDAEAFSLRTPPLSHVRETLEEEIGPDAVEDFDRILDSLETARGNGDGLDEVTISLLVAANNGELLYDISRWGEDIRLASKATFSRNKNLLEEAGLIETEKVPIDIGRPRLRLLLANGSLREADIEEVAARTEEKLA